MNKVFFERMAIFYFIQDFCVRAYYARMLKNHKRRYTMIGKILLIALVIALVAFLATIVWRTRPYKGGVLPFKPNWCQRKWFSYLWKQGVSVTDNAKKAITALASYTRREQPELVLLRFGLDAGELTPGRYNHSDLVSAVRRAGFTTCPQVTAVYLVSRERRRLEKSLIVFSEPILIPVSERRHGVYGYFLIKATLQALGCEIVTELSLQFLEEKDFSFEDGDVLVVSVPK